MASSISAPPAPAAAIDYPSSDGKPMAESDSQRKPLTYAVECLGHYFRNAPEVYVSGNLLIYYEEGTRARVAPDVFVVFGARNRKEERASYRLWEEAKAPDFVLEITSPATWRDDQDRKRELYRRLGVGEYWQYDPTRNYLRPPLQGLELVRGVRAAVGVEVGGRDVGGAERDTGTGVAGGRPAAEVPRSADGRGPAGLGGSRRRTAGVRRTTPESRRPMPGGGGSRGAGSGRPPSRGNSRPTGGGRPPGRRNPRPTGSGRPPPGVGCPPSRGNPRPTGNGCPPSGRSAFGRTRSLTTPQVRLTLPAF